MEWFHYWWDGQGPEVKAAVIGALVTVVAGAMISATVWLMFSIPRIAVWKYKRVLLDLEDSEKAIKNEVRNPVPVIVPESEIIKRSGHRQCVVKRARRWDRIRQKFRE